MTKAAAELAEKVLAWPSRERIEFAERILGSVDDFASAELKAGWDDILERRSEEIKNGSVTEIDSDDALETARRALNE